MHFFEETIRGKKEEVLAVFVQDVDDVQDICQNYTHCDCIQMDLSSLQYLQFFRCIRTLVLTGGIPSADGFKCLYLQKNLLNLILDFEETDTDEDGIDLTQFPNLQYVLSRSNLNFRNADYIDRTICTVNVLNYYKGGKKVKVCYEPNYNLFQGKNFLFFSTEAYKPAGEIIMRILVPTEKIFNEKYHDTDFSDCIEHIGIIPICLPQPLIEQGAGKIRKCVSLKKKAADVRLRLSYEELINGDWECAQKLCMKNIEEAVKYIAERDKTFKLEHFLAAIRDALNQL